MKLSSIQPETTGRPRMLNVGCGRQFHPDWINVDLEPCAAEVQAHDVRQGIPFADNSLDVVYHSHILEHLDPADGQQLIRECHRVLKPGGILRIAVPDLEKIAALYLEKHRAAWSESAGADAEYEWIKLELLDQLVRRASGGQMGRFMVNCEPAESRFVHQRVGDEFWTCRASSSALNPPRELGRRRIGRWLLNFRRWLANGCVRGLLGREGQEAFQEGLFRASGEIHRWMYDRYSLREICRQIGLDDFRVCSGHESGIPNFAEYQLDTEQGRVRKPDSLFIECKKPGSAVSLERAA